MKSLNKLALACLIGTATLLTACGDNKPAEQKTDSSSQTAGSTTDASSTSNKLETKFVTIGTGGASGPYNIIGTALAEGYASQFGANAKTQTTGASVENLNLLDQKKLEMAFVMSDALNEAVSGTGNFKAPLTNVSQIASLYPNYVQIVASQDSGIKTIEDLRGKRIAVGAQGSGVEVATRALLEGFGITYNDVKVDYLGYAEAADSLKSGKLDAAFLTSGLPNSSLMELEQGFKLQMVSVPADKLAEIAKTKTYFVPMNIPKGTYSNAEDVPTAAILNALVVRNDLSENDVYLLTKSLFESLPALQNAHQAAKDITLAKAQTSLVAPLHAGAKRYYDEVGTGTAATATADTATEQPTEGTAATETATEAKK